MPTTREIFNLTGRFYIIASPLKITRFPAPKVDDSSTVPALQYWESQRCAVWTSLTSQTRASFSWPPSGEALQPDQERAMKMDVMLGSSAKADTKEQIVHNVALDNFCLLAFKVGGMTRFEYGQFPPKRMVRFLLLFVCLVNRGGERRLIVRCMGDCVLIDCFF